VKMAIRTPSPMSSLRASGSSTKAEAPPFSLSPTLLVVVCSGIAVEVSTLSSWSWPVSSGVVSLHTRPRDEDGEKRDEGIRGVERDTLRRCKCAAHLTQWHCGPVCCGRSLRQKAFSQSMTCESIEVPFPLFSCFRIIYLDLSSNVQSVLTLSLLFVLVLSSCDTGPGVYALPKWR
jgi:hypothetical protein